MPPIKAIVLTCDKYRALTDHMIFKYGQLWPSHPFQFRVPYQDLPPSSAQGRVEPRRTPAAIKPTVLELLRDLEDDELVYWCIDDKYPIKLLVPQIERLLQWMLSGRADDVSGVLYCRCRRMWDDDCLTGHSLRDDLQNVYLERGGYEQIWIHQMLRVKVLRSLFESFPDMISVAKEMDSLITQIRKPAEHRLYVRRENLAVFGESTSRGIVTRNCRQSLREHGLPEPAWGTETTPDDIVMGELDKESVS